MIINSLKGATSLILIILTLSACNSPANISGRLTGTIKKDIKVYLIEPETLWEVGASYNGKVIDSAVVKPDGSFEFHNLPITKDSVLLEMAIQMPDKEPNYLQTYDINKSNYMPIIWESGYTIKITAKPDEFQKSFTIEHPSEINKAILNLRNINQKAYQAYLEGKHWKIEDGRELMEKENAILQYQKELIKFADSTNYMLAAMIALRWVSPENYYERVPEFLVRQCVKWKEKQAEHPWIKQLCKRSKPSTLPVLVGDLFPNIKLPTIENDTLFLNNQLGDKITIIDIWASWWAPCRIENREVLLPIWKEYHSKGLKIIAYGLESDLSSWKSATKKDGANKWLQASDLQGDDASILKETRVQTIPANYILNSKGVVLAKNVHGSDLMELVKSYLKK